MKKYFFILLSSIIGLCGASCSSRSIPINTRLTDSPESDVVVNIIQAPVVANIEVGEESVKSSDSWNLRSGSGALEERKQNLMAEMLEKYNADVILEPKVKVKRNLIGSTKLEISGYPAKYTGFRNATSEDLDIMGKANDIRDRQLYEMNQGAIEPGTVLGSGIPELPSQFWRIFVGGDLVKQGINPDAYKSKLQISGKIGMEYLRRFNFQRCYYGAKVSLGLTGMNEITPIGNESSSGNSSVFYISLIPVKLGHSLYINQAMSAYIHAGPAVNWMHTLSDSNKAPGKEILVHNGFGFGAEVGVGFQYYRLSIELSPCFIWNTPVKNATSTDFFNLNIGYSF